MVLNSSARDIGIQMPNGLVSYLNTCSPFDACTLVSIDGNRVELRKVGTPEVLVVEYVRIANAKGTA